MNRDDFFDQTDQLQLIRQWARARYAAPWAVFGAVLLRVAASTGPEVQLPGVIGGRASLNIMAAFVSASGGGKGISDKVARLAWPTDIHEEGIGSGEGIAALFTPPKDDDDRITRAIVNVPEIDTLTGLAQRQGNTILATLKAAAMGERLGSKGASAATSRKVDPHTYRLCLSVGGQPGHTGVIFDDTTGGTPQRFLWFQTTDPDMPADQIDDPESLVTTAPSWRAEGGVVEIVYGPPEIREQIIDAHLSRQRGESDALDGHAMLTRCKVAAVLAIMHGRSVVSALDWELSGVVMAESDRVREWLLTEARKADRKRVRDRAMSRAEGDEVYEQRRMEQVRKSVLGLLERDGEQGLSALRRRFGTKEKRLMFDAVVESLAADGTVILTPGTSTGSKGFRVRLSASPVGHPAKSGHPAITAGQIDIDTGHPAEGDPEGDQQNRRSTGVTKDDQGDQPQVTESTPESEVYHMTRPVIGACPCGMSGVEIDPQTGQCDNCSDPNRKIPEPAPERELFTVPMDTEERAARGYPDGLDPRERQAIRAGKKLGRRYA